MYENKWQQYFIEVHAALGFCFYFNAFYFKSLDKGQIQDVIGEAILLIGIVILYRTFKQYYQAKKDANH